MELTLHGLTDLYKRFRDDEVPALGAQMTYYLLLSFFPFLIFLVSLLNYTQLTGEIILGNLEPLLPYDAYVTVNNIIAETAFTGSNTLLSIGMIITIWTASNGVNAIIRGINKAYSEKETRPFWKVRGISILFTLALALAFLFALIMLVLGRIVGVTLINYLGASYLLIAQLWEVFRYLVPLGTILVTFLFFYKYSPNRYVSFREVLPGSLFTTIGWILSSVAFSFYVNNFVNFALIYGSLGGIFILLIWLYISSIIVLIGGEINALMAFSKTKH